jgi:hypothetical protein
VFESKVSRKIFGPKKEEVTEGWRKLHKEKFHNLYTLPHIIMVIKLMRTRRTRMRQKKNADKILVGKPEERNNLEDLDVNGSIILKCIIRNEDMKV